MSYVDGFVVPVPEKNLADYRKMARKAGKIWREHGALEAQAACGTIGHGEKHQHRDTTGRHVWHLTDPGTTTSAPVFRSLFFGSLPLFKAAGEQLRRQRCLVLQIELECTPVERQTARTAVQGLPKPELLCTGTVVRNPSRAFAGDSFCR